MDTRVFINPALLEICSKPGFADVCSKVEDYFLNIISLLRHLKVKDNMFWKRRLRFREISGTCFCYSENGIGRKIIGSVLHDAVLRTIKELMAKGETDSALFELLSIFQEGIGWGLVI